MKVVIMHKTTTIRKTDALKSDSQLKKEEDLLDRSQQWSYYQPCCGRWQWWVLWNWCWDEQTQDGSYHNTLSRRLEKSQVQVWWSAQWPDYQHCACSLMSMIETVEKEYPKRHKLYCLINSFLDLPSAWRQHCESENQLCHNQCWSLPILPTHLKFLMLIVPPVFMPASKLLTDEVFDVYMKEATKHINRSCPWVEELPLICRTHQRPIALRKSWPRHRKSWELNHMEMPTQRARTTVHQAKPIQAAVLQMDLSINKNKPGVATISSSEMTLP